MGRTANAAELAQLKSTLECVMQRLDKLRQVGSDIPVDEAAESPSARFSRTPPPDDYTPLLRSLYAERRARDAVFGDDARLFGEPAWDILLDLLVQAAEGKSVSVTSACTGSCVPPTTALRWLDILLSEGLIERLDDPLDHRRAFVRLSKKGLARMRAVAEAMTKARSRHLR